MESLSPGVEQAGIAALEAWAEPQIANAGWLQRSAIKEYLEAHKQMIIEAVGPAIIAKFKEENGL